MSRLVVVSNRLPSGSTPSGGLVVALQDALADGGLWVGNSNKLTDTPADRLTRHEGGKFTRMSFDLTEEEQRDFYLGYSNSVLWPLCHDRVDLMELLPQYLESYRAVNKRIAKMIARELQPDDRIWVQDYHFLSLGYELRQLGVTQPIGFFLHIPFPGPNAFAALSHGQEVCRWIAAFDLFGLQARRDVSACLQVFRTAKGAELLLNGRMKLEDQIVQVASFPIAIDPEEFARTARNAPTAGLDDAAATIIGVDRLDYSKGLPQRFRAYGHLLDAHPELSGQVALLQIAPPTREAVKAYQDIRDELEQLSGHINGAHATLDWTPIRYIHRSVPRERLAGLYRGARVGLVTPLADGMNLVAKEYVAAQDADDPGVLILSKFAGAAEQLFNGALIVNPHDIAEMAEAMNLALNMPLGERRERYQSMRKVLADKDVAWWREQFLTALSASWQSSQPQMDPA